MCKNILNLSPIRVSIQSNGPYIENIYIKDKLQKIFSSEVILFSESNEQSDVVLTNIPRCRGNSQDTFYLKNIFDDEGWKELISHLIDKIISTGG